MEVFLYALVFFVVWKILVFIICGILKLVTWALNESRLFKW